MNVSPFFDVRDPLAMSQQERFAEIVVLLARGLGRFVDDQPRCSQPTTGISKADKRSAKVLLNQLDVSEIESVGVSDENA